MKLANKNKRKNQKNEETGWSQIISAEKQASLKNAMI